MRSVLWLLVPVALVACESSSQPVASPPQLGERTSNPTAGPPAPNAGGAVANNPTTTSPAVAPPSFDGAGAFAVPPDMRTPIVAPKPPPAISGGTLLLINGGSIAIAADPDRDRVSIVDLKAHRVKQHVLLQAGDEPGRLALDAAGLVHVVLRGSGDVAALDVAKGAIKSRVHVCNDPRGISYDRGRNELLVACMSGELVAINAADASVTRSQRVADDLRDVVVQDGRVFVSQFRSANLLSLDGAGAVRAKYHPGNVGERLVLGRDALTGSSTLHNFAATVARRTIALPDGRMLILHQRAMTDTVDIGDRDEGETGGDDSGDDSGDEDSGGDTGDAPPSDSGFAPPAPPGAGGYGSGESCQSIVQTAVTIVEADGSLVQSRSVAGAVVPVDVAISRDGKIAVANAGLRDNGPFGGVVGSGPGVIGGPGIVGIGGGVSIFDAKGGEVIEEGDIGDSCALDFQVATPGQPTAVAFTDDGLLVVQSREPAMIVLPSPDAQWMISLGGSSMADTGHDIFHRDSGGGLACASCHAEGGDDGHVWDFRGFGVRRTQSLNIGLRDTAPFHWSGDMPDLTTLMSEVFVKRMSGAPQSPERVEALANWVFQQKHPSPLRAASDPMAVAGKQLFESKEVGCASCHNGAAFTNNKTEDVGTGAPFQVPSLVGIAHRAPFIHTGCAATLRDRFDPSCGGGDKHGHTAQLGAADLDALVAYLETL